jgi:nitrous oxide reductase
MNELTRRRFVRTSAGAAAGITAIGAMTASRADADAAAAHTEPVVAYLKDPSTGEISIMHGDRESVIHDRALAGRLARAAR